MAKLSAENAENIPELSSFFTPSKPASIQGHTPSQPLNEITNVSTDKKRKLPWTQEDTPDRSLLGRNGILDTRDPFKGGRTGKLNQPIVATADAIADFRLALQHLRRNNENWSRVSAGDRLLLPFIGQLSDGQRRIYVQLRELVYTYVETYIGTDKFDDIDVHWVWTWATWHRAVLKMATWTNADCTGAKSDCWSTVRGASGDGKYRWGITPGRIERRRQTSGVGDWQWYPTTDLKSTSSISRMACALLHGPPMDGAQCSHQCHNIPQTCCNPWHCCWEEDEENKQRNYCVNGAAAYCPHVPRCIFTNASGNWLKHRNTETIEACDCEVDCHKARILE